MKVDEEKKDKEKKEACLSGYYPPEHIDDWEKFQELWSTGPHAEAHWIWLEGDYSQEDIKELIAKGDVEVYGED